MAELDLTKFSPIREDFPELSDTEFGVSMLYAFGATYDEIEHCIGITKPMVKKSLNSSKCKLSLESTHSIRVVVNFRTNLNVINIIKSIKK
ncbi:hypothetical protein C9426_23860 [Serratia sp. S1B]|nr:hypothetical protein C9426_23860 [Serratia sp. S1B]